jgi:hypothetical protein
MPTLVTLNPMLVTTAPGTFSVQSEGYVQGTALDDPAARFDLAGGILSVTETLPMWGGVGIYEYVPYPAGTPGQPADNLGSIVGRATTLVQTGAGGLIGFSVFNQAFSWITTPGSQVPLGTTGMTVPFYRFGSGARICVQCDPSLASLEGGSVGAQVSWDFNAQALVPYTATSSALTITSQTWSTTNGGQVAVVMSAASPVNGIGDMFTIAGTTNSGTGGTAAINTTHTANTWTDNQHFTYLLPGTAAQWGTLAGTMTLAVSGGALAVKVLQVAIGNSKTVTYDGVNLVANWNNAGSTAVIII